MLTLVDLRGYAGDPLERLPRATVDRDAARATVREIIAAVRARGDAAALELQARYGPAPVSLRVSPEEIDGAFSSCAKPLRSAIEHAASRIRAYHERQLA